MLTDRELRLLRPLTSDKAANGLPAGMRYIDELGEMSRKGLVSLSGARTGLFRDPDIFWVRITEAGRAALANTTEKSPLTSPAGQV